MHAIFFLLAGCLSAAAATAQTESPWRFSGYYTLGHAQLDSDTARRFARDQTQSQPDAWAVDSRLGLQLDGRLTPTVGVTAQTVLRRRVADTPAGESVEWAFVHWAPTPDWQLRLGRTSPDIFLFADVRSVGVAYPWVRPSQESYAWMPIQSVDGVDLSRLWADDDASWRLKLSFGHASSRLAAQESGTPGMLKLHAVRTASLSRETPTTRLKLSYLSGRIDLSRAPVLTQLDQALAQVVAQTRAVLPALAAEAEALRLGQAVDSPAQYLALGGQQELGNWQITGELSRSQGRAKSGNAQRHMLSLGRRFDAFTLFGILGRSRLTEPALAAPYGWQAQLTPLVGPAAAAQITALGVGASQAGNLGRTGQRSFGLGVRWDLRADLAVKAQWDHVRVERDGRSLWALKSAGDSGDFSARVLTFTVDGSF